MKRTISLFLILALVLSFGITASAEEPTKPSDTMEGDVWDGSITQPTKLVQKDGVYYYEITKCSELAYVAQTGGDWLTYNYILGTNLILNDVFLTWDEDGNILNTTTQLNDWTSIGIYEGLFDGAGYVITGLFDTNDHGAAGLFAKVYGSVTHLSIKNAYIQSGYSSGSIGGIAGEVFSGSIDNCSFSGLLLGKNDIGGIVGHSRSSTSIYNCTAAGSIIHHSTDDWSNNGSLGGICGRCESNFQSSISHCIASVQLHSTTICESIGGITGTFYGYYNEYDNRYNVSINNCYSTSTIQGTAYSSGGLVGFLCDGLLSKCSSSGALNTSSDQAGGLVGHLGGSIVIEQCYSTCDVINSSGCAGNFIGSSDTNMGTIKNSYASGTSHGLDYSSGFVARNKSNVVSCYSTGTVTGGTNQGGFIGEDRRIWGDDFTLTNNYFLKDTGINSTLWGTSTATSDEADAIESKTYAEMQTQSTYEGWDFDAVWAIDPDKNGGYPYLQWQESILTDIPATSITLDETTLSLSVGDSAYLTATVSPANASDRDVIWSSDDEAVATVTRAGKVIAAGEGSATITASSTDGKITATCEVTVTERVANEFQIDSITIRDDNGTLLTSISPDTFLATISITNLASQGDTMVLLAGYTSSNQYAGLMYVTVKGCPIGATIEVTLPIDNNSGKIAQLKAFTVSSFTAMQPLGSAAEFPHR